MPQLNPNPWFLILLMSWTIFSLVFQPKLLQFTTSNPPSNMNLTTTKATSWVWPWT